MKKIHLLYIVFYLLDFDDLYVKTPTTIMEKYGYPLVVPCRPTFQEVDVDFYRLEDDTPVRILLMILHIFTIRF